MGRLVGLGVVVFALAGGLVIWPDYGWSSLTMDDILSALNY